MAERLDEGAGPSGIGSEEERIPLQPPEGFRTSPHILVPDVRTATIVSLDDSTLLKRMKRRILPYIDCERACISIRNLTNEIINHVYFVIVLFILLALPGSAILLGAANLSRCPASAETPIQVIILGILGCFVIILRIMDQSLKPMGEFSWKPVLIVLTCLSTIATFSFFLAHIVTFFNITLNDDSSAMHCNKIFYDFTYYTNFVVIFISSVVMMLHVPVLSFVVSYIHHYVIRYKRLVPL